MDPHGREVHVHGRVCEQRGHLERVAKWVLTVGKFVFTVG